MHTFTTYTLLILGATWKVYLKSTERKASTPPIVCFIQGLLSSFVCHRELIPYNRHTLFQEVSFI